MRRGLTVGKFAPLHAGHQLLIETALREVDQLVVVIYDCPATTNLPLPLRAAWLRDLYPTIRVIEAWDGPTEVGDTSAIKGMHEDYIINRLGIREISHFYSSEFYGEHMSAALGAVNRLVDPNRVRLPISGTLVRSDPAHYRAWLHPRVYRDLISNIVLLGAPSTGKTTLAQRLAATYRTVWMPEYGREYWETHQTERRLTLAQLVEIAEGHLEREERLLLQADRYLFTDTNALTTAMFSLDYHGNLHPRLAELAHQAAARYDVVVLCEDDIPYADTWDRSGAVQRQIFQKKIIADLLLRRIPFVRVRGTIEQRIAQVQAVLATHYPYQNLYDRQEQ